MLRTLTLLCAAGGLVALHLGLQPPRDLTSATPGTPVAGSSLPSQASRLAQGGPAALASMQPGPVTVPGALPAAPRAPDAERSRATRLAALVAREVARERRQLSASFTPEDQCLAEAVFHEARGEPLKGQLAVAQVVLNRVGRSDRSICDVVFERRAERCQFSFACDPARASEGGPAWATARAVAQLALAGRVPDVTRNATHFHATRVSPAWSRVYQHTLTIGRHMFYRSA